MQLAQLRGYGWALAAAATATLAGLAMQARFDVVNIAMVFVLGVALVALRQPRGPSIAAAIFGIVAFDWIFVPPQGALTIDDAQYLFTFGVMMAIALMISGLMSSNQRRAREQAELSAVAEGERLRSTLLASISHDLRTPLAVLAGASSALAERGEAMPPEQRTALARAVYERSRDMAAEVEKILDMTRLDAGAVTLESDWVSVEELVGEVRNAWASLFTSHRLMVQLGPELPLVRGDAALLAKALGNLVENALRHTPAGTLVRIRADRDAGRVVISVEDFGTDMAPDALERAFAKFDHASPEGSTAGLGLGLAICRAVVRLHGGSTWAERLDGGGTAFRMALPAAPSPAIPAEAVPA